MSYYKVAVEFVIDAELVFDYLKEQGMPANEHNVVEAVRSITEDLDFNALAEQGAMRFYNEDARVIGQPVADGPRMVCSDCGSPEIEYLPHAGDDPYCPRCHDFTGAVEEDEDAYCAPVSRLGRLMLEARREQAANKIEEKK